MAGAVWRVVNAIAYTPTQSFWKLPILQRCSLIPLLYFCSSLCKLGLSARHRLYSLGVFNQRRLAVPVISVGNLTWGGNGKTPMVEFLALFFANAGISPLVLTRGYAGGDEAKMLQRHLSATSAKIGVGANRFATATSFLEPQSGLDRCWNTRTHKNQDIKMSSNSDKIGVVVLDDGMQHWSLYRDVDIVMVNGMKPWGNNQLLPLGPLREPLVAFKRADVVVIHHADLVSERELKVIQSRIYEEKHDVPIFCTSLLPSCFFEVSNRNSALSLSVINNLIVLCVSAIGSPDAFVRGIQKLGPVYVDRLDFSDHHLFQGKDIEMIKVRLKKLQDGYGSKPVVVVTEKDYDRDPDVLNELYPFEVLVLCSQLQIRPYMEYTQVCFQTLVKQLLERKFSTSNLHFLRTKVVGATIRQKCRQYVVHDRKLNKLPLPLTNQAKKFWWVQPCSPSEFSHLLERRRPETPAQCTATGHWKPGRWYYEN